MRSYPHSLLFGFGFFRPALLSVIAVLALNTSIPLRQKYYVGEVSLLIFRNQVYLWEFINRGGIKKKSLAPGRNKTCLIVKISEHTDTLNNMQNINRS